MADMDEFRQVLKSSKHIICVAGAGLSAASGIPTFRGAGGLWRKYKATSLGTPTAFARDPSLVWQFYHYRREAVLKANPNDAHRALARFSIPSIRHAISPDSTFTLITQNVDGLSAISLEEVKRQYPGEIQPETQPPILEMHGRVFDVKCSSCDHVSFDRSSPICESLRGTEKLVEKHTHNTKIPESDLPRCAKCGGLARPGVVWFEEIPDYLETIDKLVEEADLCLVVGTSSTVYPAGGYAYAVKENGGTVAVFNLERSEGDEDADFLFLGPCEEILPKALGT